MCPVTTNLDIGLGDLGVAEQEPETEDGLGENVKNSVGNDFVVDRGLAGTVRNTPDTERIKIVGLSDQVFCTYIG